MEESNNAEPKTPPPIQTKIPPGFGRITDGLELNKIANYDLLNAYAVESSKVHELWNKSEVYNLCRNPTKV